MQSSDAGALSKYTSQNVRQSRTRAATSPEHGKRARERGRSGGICAGEQKEDSTATARAAEEEGYGREDLGPGGTDPSGRYSWERCGASILFGEGRGGDQNGLTILVTAPVDEEVTKKDISASFSLRQVSISVKGEALIDGVPGCELDSEECFWEIEDEGDGKKLIIHLAKKGRASRWPDTLLK
ncbi:unnamed protein product [Effrenium voratum]|nr:unnamed protein product [Effrenium voratum]